MRAKLRVWSKCVYFISAWPLLIIYCSRSIDGDAQDVLFILNRYWASIDLNRIPEADMERLVSVYPTAEAPWAAVKQRYA
jgi:hypothetical protein